MRKDENSITIELPDTIKPSIIMHTEDYIVIHLEKVEPVKRSLLRSIYNFISLN